jgi:hypothetical protein
MVLVLRAGYLFVQVPQVDMQRYMSFAGDIPCGP